MERARYQCLGGVILRCWHARLTGVAQREFQIFSSFEAAERADDEYYAALDPQERLGILLDLVAAYRESTGENSARLERVYRVTELSRG